MGRARQVSRCTVLSAISTPVGKQLGGRRPACAPARESTCGRSRCRRDPNAACRSATVSGFPRWPSSREKRLRVASRRCWLSSGHARRGWPARSVGQIGPQAGRRPRVRGGGHDRFGPLRYHQIRTRQRRVIRQGHIMATVQIGPASAAAGKQPQLAGGTVPFKFEPGIGQTCFERPEAVIQALLASFSWAIAPRKAARFFATDRRPKLTRTEAGRVGAVGDRRRHVLERPPTSCVTRLASEWALSPLGRTVLF